MKATDNFKYFVDDVEVTKEELQSYTGINFSSFIVSGLNIHYKTKSKHGLSTRLKAAAEVMQKDYSESIEPKIFLFSKSNLTCEDLKPKMWETNSSFLKWVDEQIENGCTIKPKNKNFVDNLKKEVGVKHNQHKAPLDILQTRQFPKALQVLALATAFGNNKYKETDKDFLNFKRVPGGSQTYFDAAARHNTARNERDKDSDLYHVIHSVWNMMAALELWIEEKNIDVSLFSNTYLTNLNITK